MHLTIIRIGQRWFYESDQPHGTPSSVTHVIHVPDPVFATAIKGRQRYWITPHAGTLIDRPLSAAQLLRLAHLRICTEIYVQTTII